MSGERREFEKYLKFFVLKSLQVIVQSRKGEKLRTSSRSASVDWFSLDLPDDKSVLSELKKASQSRIPQHRAPICVEISLKSENDSIIVELWTISIDSSFDFLKDVLSSARIVIRFQSAQVCTTDPSAKATSVVYPRMTLMIKSLLTVSRLLPAYKLSRQPDEEWTICYRVFTGFDSKAEKVDLGPNPTQVDVSYGITPFGKLQLEVTYRRSVDLFDGPNQVGAANTFTRQYSSQYGSLASGQMSLSNAGQVPFSGQGMPNDVDFQSLKVQQFSRVLEYDRQSSLLPSLTPDMASISAEDQSESLIPANDQQRPQTEDFVVLDNALKPVFAPDSQPSDDLGQFFQECKNPPNLDMFSGPTALDINSALMEDFST